MVDISNKFQYYQENFENIEGFFIKEAQGIWDFFLSIQQQMNVSGDLIEIGVYKGKSAILGSLYLEENEKIILIDINNIRETEEMIHSIKELQVEKFIGKSSEFVRSEVFKNTSNVRWFHIDGDHSGFSTTTDLEIAAQIVRERGLICVDDFFNIRYPQLAASVYRFLFSKSNFQLLLCGFNKAFICHKQDYTLYEALIKKYLVSHMKNLGFLVTIHKTSYAHDFGCFSITERVEDYDIIGRDEDKHDIVF